MSDLLFFLSQEDKATDGASNGVSEAVPMTAEIDPLSLPPHGTEVFIGSLNRSATEDEVRDFASQAGEVFTVKLMREPSNANASRGFGFVVYADRESALRAMDKLHGKEMEPYPDNKVRVQPSQSKNRLFVGGLPHSLTKEELHTFLEKELGLKGLLSIDLARSKDNPDENRGFTFLEFYNAACALQAKARLGAPSIRIGDRQINVDLAEPMGQEASMAQATKTVFVGNLPQSVTETQLKDAFSKYGEVEKVHLPRPKASADSDTEQPRYGFVQFAERVSALHAVEDPEKPHMEGTELAVKYGKAEGQYGASTMGPQGMGSGAGTGMGGRGNVGFGGGGRGGGRFGAYQNRQQYSQQYYPYGQQQQPQQQQQQQQQHHMQQQYGMDSGGYMMGGMVPMVPVQLPNGQFGYMVQPAGAAAMGAAGMGGGPVRSRGGWRGGYGGGGRGRGGGPGPYQRYQPY